MRDIIQIHHKKQKASKKWQYNNLVQQARKLEQEDNYEEASKLWNKALKLAPTEKQKGWCSYRDSHCKRTAEVKILVEKNCE
ncbi:Uncharacterised protein [Phocoenobacter uteri]|uniref:Uncharacterized protein n=1 Tax=Phocoenobacter uteri TaxID=146806 RepID=A0A379DFD4_9PAST|nr:ANR family transcriptional regulator [Phocoenobacter uteri]MDG6880983.1 hypothetical protein [Phocoenobacter uteri]SUB59002.1 Uncharacterised protein [Phocoenobacter uteri]SUB76460.1 Uncharacterised protein [Phocoenobacter uteri]